MTDREREAAEILISMPAVPTGKVAECVDDYIAYGRTLSAADLEALDARADAKARARALSSAVVEAYEAEVERRVLTLYSARDCIVVIDAFVAAGLGRERAGDEIARRTRAVEIQALMRESRGEAAA